MILYYSVVIQDRDCFEYLQRKVETWKSLKFIVKDKKLILNKITHQFRSSIDKIRTRNFENLILTRRI